MHRLLRLVAFGATLLAAWILDTRSYGGAFFHGANGGACTESMYNCKLRVSGGNRIDSGRGGDTWAVDPGAMLLDGNGDPLVPSQSSELEFNYGQIRVFHGKRYAFAMTSSNGSSAWFPVASIQDKTGFLDKVGHVWAFSRHLPKMGCYAIKNSSDPQLELKKVVYDATDTHERAGDYLPLLRASGQRSANLAFNVPGFGLGGVAIDHFPAGTKFRRLRVPTHNGQPSIDIPLWVQDSLGRYRKQDGTMKFVYGYVVSKTGTKRIGWMAYDALEPSGGCR